MRLDRRGVRLAPSAPTIGEPSVAGNTSEEAVMSQLQTAERPTTASALTAGAGTATLVRRPAATTGWQLPTRAACRHEPRCPEADAVDHGAARVVAAHPEQGWSQLCNGVIIFDDTGELLPDGRASEPHRGPAPHVALPGASG
jgi:hypothetical protein